MGAFWNNETGKYDYTQEFFDSREAQLKKARIRQQALRKERMKMLRVTRPHLFKVQKTQNTLDAYIKNDNGSTNAGIAGENLRESQFPIS